MDDSDKRTMVYEVVYKSIEKNLNDWKKFSDKGMDVFRNDKIAAEFFFMGSNYVRIFLGELTFLYPAQEAYELEKLLGLTELRRFNIIELTPIAAQLSASRKFTEAQASF
ncbi:MAG: hypothetical protein PHO56_02525 [Patescibacteria group bacterium]|nr:hypothetical protein [Patescibacteria group bacterium]